MPGASSTFRWGILALFFVSGAPALLYQIVWQHHLFTIFGAHAESVAIIVGAFMLGLGLGSLLGGELSARTRRSAFLLFAAVESLIAAFGLVSLQLFDAVGRATASAGLLGGGVASFLLVVVPTVAMGATLPILANALIARLGNVGVSVGQLYFVNTLGSAGAAFFSRHLFHHGLGQRGVVWVSVSLNAVVVVGALVLWLATRGRLAERKAAPPAVAPDAFTRAHAFAMVLSFFSGFLALSAEILWFRVVFLATNGRAYAFPLALAYFLLGIASGSLLASRLVRSWGAGDVARIRSAAAAIMLGSGVAVSLAFLASGLLVTQSKNAWVVALTFVLALPLGLLFPLLVHAGVLPGSGAGRSVSHVYAANIAGSVAGSVGTGFVLLELLPLRANALLLSVLALAIALALRRDLRLGLGAAVGLGVFVASWAGNRALLERLQLAEKFDGSRFAHVVENRNGVIEVTHDGVVYGSGVYDGHYSIDLVDDRNLIVRAFAIAAFRPPPRRVLVIGLASGSWAQVLAHLPGEPTLDVIEINPGHLELIPRQPVVASLLTNPRVRVVIEDGRRWLTRHPGETYDLIVMNTTYYWRAGSTNLLSREFLELLRPHLNPGGVVMYNTTGSRIVNGTGLAVFPHAWRVYNALVVSDAPLPLDRERFLHTLETIRIDGRPVLERNHPAHAAAFERLAAHFDPAQPFDHATFLEPYPSLAQRYAGAPLLTDDNMLVEWEQVGP